MADDLPTVRPEVDNIMCRREILILLDHEQILPRGPRVRGPAWSFGSETPCAKEASKQVLLLLLLEDITT